MTAGMPAANRDDLYALVDALPDNELNEARRYLSALQEANPAVRAALLAPIDDEPLTPEDRRAIDEAKAAYNRGDWIADDDLKL
jgi:hypothetical protein